MNPLRPWKSSRRNPADTAELYGAIVAQARLPAFYRELGVPDTLDGRFLVLSLHLFAVLHRLKAAGDAGLDLAQALTDRFSEDMETVLREVGVGDLAIPKKMRGLAATSAGLFGSYEKALAEGEEALAATMAEALPLPKAAMRHLAHYVTRMVRALEGHSVGALAAGTVHFPESDPAEEFRDDEEH